jgi:hypothetical protein
VRVVGGSSILQNRDYSELVMQQSRAKPGNAALGDEREPLGSIHLAGPCGDASCPGGPVTIGNPAAALTPVHRVEELIRKKPTVGGLP